MTTMSDTAVIYDLQGTLLEACSCGVLCPCWVGADPDGGSCDAVNAYHFDSGTIRGVDVSGLSAVLVVKIPGNVLTPGSWQVVRFIDEKATDEQMAAILDAYRGNLGGPLADLAGLIGEEVAVERAQIVHEIRDGRGTLLIGDAVSAEMAPFLAADGTTTTLRDSLFSTVPGSPAYVGRADHSPSASPSTGWRGRSRAATPSRPTTTSAIPRADDHHRHRPRRLTRLGPRRTRAPCLSGSGSCVCWAAAPIAVELTGTVRGQLHHDALIHGAAALAAALVCLGGGVAGDDRAP